MHFALRPLERRDRKEADMRDFKVAMSAQHASEMTVKAVRDLGIPIYSRIETLDWPNYLTLEELLEVTIPIPVCGCGQAHHMGTN